MIPYFEADVKLKHKNLEKIHIDCQGYPEAFSLRLSGVGRARETPQQKHLASGDTLRLTRGVVLTAQSDLCRVRRR